MIWKQNERSVYIDDIAGVRSNVIGYKTRLIGIDNVEEQQQVKIFVSAWIELLKDYLKWNFFD